jgi:hypothetical protein
VTARVALLGAIALAALLRGMAVLEPQLGIELSLGYPQNAVLGVAGRTWKPFSLVHGSFLSDVLRGLTTSWYAIGWLVGRYEDRLALLVDFVRDPFPFIVMGRVVMLAAAVAAVWLAARVAARLGGRVAAAAAAFVLAVSFAHVRSSLQIWPDGFVATATVATILAALVHLERGGIVTAAALGAVAALALASKPAVAALGVPVALALWWGGEPTLRAGLRRFAVASATTVIVFVAVSPHYVINWNELLLHARVQAMGSLSSATPWSQIGWSALLRIMLGTGPVVLGAVGVVAAVARTPRAAIVASAFPVLYLAMLARANPYARYFAVAAPLVAVFAGVGAAALAERIAPRRAGAIAALLVAVAVAPGAVQSWRYVRLIARPDTRILAGHWLERHVAPGTSVTLPNLVGYANPVVAKDGKTLALEYPRWQKALAARGLGDPERTFRLHYLGMFEKYPPFEPRDPVVVTAAHPTPSAVLATPADHVERLRAAGYRVAARFDGAPDPAPPGLVYDPQDADYLPLTGAEQVPQLGPTLTIWTAP